MTGRFLPFTAADGVFQPRKSTSGLEHSFPRKEEVVEHPSQAQVAVGLQAYLFEFIEKFKTRALILLTEFWQRLNKTILPKLRTEL